MARHPNWSLVEKYKNYKSQYPELNNTELAKLMETTPRQIRRISNDYLKREDSNSHITA